MRPFLSAALFLACALPVAAAPDDADNLQRLANDYVAKSSRYMHHSRLARGMTGYGLTVMEGTRIDKFDAAVISVMRNFSPRQDVILCRLSGLGLEKTGVIEGMSGSPVFVKDPADGKDKMIGAVAYGWQLGKEPICGIQPIAQMLVIGGAELLGGGAKGPVEVRAQAGGKPAAVPAAAGELDDAFAAAVLDPRRLDFRALAGPGQGGAADDSARMRPLATPVMISGARGESIERARRLFAGTALTPVQSGALGQVDAAALGAVKLEPGSAIAVPLVTGDADYSAVGTVTEVVGNYVFAFGHSFFGEGDVRFPMGPAYVHTVIPSIMSSFKLGSGIRATGVLTADEETGVGGTLGGTAETVPMTVQVYWGDVCLRKYKYELVRHRWFTARLAGGLLNETIMAHRQLPQRHTLDYTIDIDFDRLGHYRGANRSSGSGAGDVVSDLSRPLMAMANTDLGKPVFPRAIDVVIKVQTEQTTAEVLSLELERNSYKPGVEVKGRVTLRPFRGERQTVPVSIQLPADLPDGAYAVSASGGTEHLLRERMEMPHRYSPRTVEQLFEAVNRLAAARSDALMLHLPLGQAGGLAVRKQELDRLPGSLSDILRRTAPVDTNDYQRSVTTKAQTPFVLSGEAAARFTVKKDPREQMP